MQEKFPEYYRPSADEFDSLWREALFVPDTNVLLNLYRYSESTRSDLLRILYDLQNKLWIPHQVAQEFLDRRLGVIHEKETKHVNLRDKLSKFEAETRNDAEALHRGAHFESQELLNNLTESITALSNDLLERERKLPNLSNSPSDDDVWSTIEELFIGKIGDPYSKDKLEEIVRDGESRDREKTPPGYRDEGHGDLIIWHQIMDKASETNSPIVFVTDDLKEDWWWESKGKTIGPRKELVKEIREKSGVRFHMYDADQFIKQANQYLDSKVSQNTLSEVEHLSRQSQQAADQQQLLTQALHNEAIVSSAQREILDLYFNEGHTIEEIREILGYPSTEYTGELLRGALHELRWWLSDQERSEQGTVDPADLKDRHSHDASFLDEWFSPKRPHLSANSNASEEQDIRRLERSITRILKSTRSSKEYEDLKQARRELAEYRRHLRRAREEGF